MKNSELKDFFNQFLKDDKIKSVEILGWEECGEYNGEDPRPRVKVEKFNYKEYNNTD